MRHAGDSQAENFWHAQDFPAVQQQIDACQLVNVKEWSGRPDLNPTNGHLIRDMATDVSVF